MICEGRVNSEGRPTQLAASALCLIYRHLLKRWWRSWQGLGRPFPESTPRGSHGANYDA